MFIRKISQYIEDRQLFFPGAKILVALSGGADSVALLRVLLQLGYSCAAAHCNFHLRGAESDRDEAFVRGLCQKFGVPLSVIHFDTQAYAAQKGLSIEMAARELRYEWFENTRKEIHADFIAVAHHRDDSVETFLLNLIRGTGIAGLTGIAAVNGKIIRPLLGAGRSEILDYLAELGQDYVTDSTNLEDAYTRNKLRLNILPLLREINPSVDESIMETAHRLADVETVYRKSVLESCKRVMENENSISIPRLLEEPSPQAVLFELLYPLGFNAAQQKDVYRSLSAESGRLFYSKTHRLLKDRNNLLIQKLENRTVCMTLHQKVVDLATAKTLLRHKNVACLDRSKIHGPLVLRKWQAGDRFIPFGMKGFKRVRDYLCDRKFSLYQKEEQYVVCAGEDIVWLVNERTDNRYRVTDATTAVLVLSVEPSAE